ncbi:MAG TPA: hypothetical protein VF988_03130 [Verrucomicrobiae bacterium]
MKQQPDNEREGLWRRQPTDAELAALRGQPDLELEARLTQALAKLPATPAPSNFTARVLDAIELEERQAARAQRHWLWSWPRWLPRVAVAAAIVVFASLGYQHYEQGAQHAVLVRNVAQVAAAQPLPSVDTLENLDAIQRMSQTAHADTELLAALQ